VLPKLSNYLAFQSFDLELPDEGYSRNVHVLICYHKQTNTKQNKPIKNIKQKEKNPT
jgi:hypothetical protein